MLAYTKRPDIDPSGHGNGKAIPHEPGPESLEIMIEIIFGRTGRKVAAALRPRLQITC
jgi:hypothetical protein